MAVELLHHCDGPDCEASARVLAVIGRPPVGFMTVTAFEEPDRHFCSWDCAMRFAAKLPPTETIYPDGDPRGDGEGAS